MECIYRKRYSTMEMVDLAVLVYVELCNKSEHFYYEIVEYHKDTRAIENT